MRGEAPGPEETYRRDKLPVQLRFDEVETTISHLFRRPHPALGGRSFGGALHAALRARGLLIDDTVWELGGGAGFVAAAMVAAGKAEGRPLRYGFLDLSRNLLAVQRQQVPDAPALQVGAERLPFRTGALRGLLLANEVIADLRIGPATGEEAKALIARYGLPAEGRRINVGALHFLEELARVLAPGSAACLTEFGGDFAPSPVPLEGSLGTGRHVEHSIHFGHLALAAAQLGFQVERVLLADLIGVDRTARVTSYPDVMRLRRFVPRLPVLAHPKAELERMHPVLTRLFRFELPEIGSPRFPDPQAKGGFCQLFHALLLRRDERSVPP